MGEKLCQLCFRIKSNYLRIYVSTEIDFQDEMNFP